MKTVRNIQRRVISSIYILFFHQLVRSLPFGHETQFQFTLRPNEPRRVSVRPDNSFWQAYDVTTNFPLFINGRHHLETYFLAYGTNLDARITSRKRIYIQTLLQKNGTAFISITSTFKLPRSIEVIEILSFGCQRSSQQELTAFLYQAISYLLCYILKIFWSTFLKKFRYNFHTISYSQSSTRTSEKRPKCSKIY